MAEERWVPSDSIRVKLPVNGEYDILHSLTWHRSSPNSTSSDRPHISDFGFTAALDGGLIW